MLIDIKFRIQFELLLFCFNIYQGKIGLTFDQVPGIKRKNYAFQHDQAIVKQITKTKFLYETRASAISEFVKIIVNDSFQNLYVH